MITNEEYDKIRSSSSELRYVDTIENEPLRRLTEEAIKKYSDIDKLSSCYDVISLHMGFLEAKNQLTENSRPAWVDLFVAAGYMHNMFYDGSVTSLFMAREKISDLAKELSIPVNGISLLFSAIEGQFGDRTPVEACIPSEASPNALFAKAVYVVDVYSGKVNFPGGTSY